MNPDEIINHKIDKIKYHYDLTDGFQVSSSYLKLSNGKIIDLPHYHNLEKISIDSRLENSKKNYKKAKRINRKEREKIQGQSIVDIHYCFYENESDEERRAHIELSNGMYLTEENYGVVGMSIGLILRNKEEFDRLKNELEDGFEIRSYLREIKNVS
ncbi:MULTISPECIES: hypothetical protein [Flavobacteriaceae]|uniref:hypothetical protein n=1 Tax=Flavobacteriaceae TaxID=49546 RepID=UPI002349D99F|nr:hypothetical protein [Muricauda sp. SP22]MDC6363285.1 hypothetical protein [Muricauda sp. SP22]